MEDKPKEILELERALGIGSVSIYNIEYGKLVSLAIFGENLQDITPISALKQLTSLDLTYMCQCNVSQAHAPAPIFPLVYLPSFMIFIML